MSGRTNSTHVVKLADTINERNITGGKITYSSQKYLQLKPVKMEEHGGLRCNRSPRRLRHVDFAPDRSEVVA
jgi:hypothetical protein